MNKTQTQVGILALLSGLVLMTPSPTFSKDNFTTRPTLPSGASGAGGNKVFSVGEIFDTLGHSLSDLIPSGEESSTDEADTKATQASKKESSKTKKESSAQEPELIKAKRLDASEEPQKEAAPPAPYKVYSAPIIAPEPEDEMNVYDEGSGRTYSSSRSSYTSQHEERTPLVGRSGASNPIDIKEPPPLPDYVKRDVKNNPEGELPPTKDKQQTPKPNEVPSISALPKQFFPIFPLGAGKDAQEQLLPVASNIEIEADHSATRRAIIFIHDMQRNSAEGVAMLMTLAGSEEEPPLILAPQFSLELDIVRFAQHLPENGRNVARWPLEDPWQFGGESLIKPNPRGISSFTAIDLLLLFLTDKQRFPSLEQVVVLGHGTGADFVQRYAVVGQAPDILEKEKIIPRFVVANASSYLYMTNMRPSGGTGTPFKPADLKSCEKVVSYPYGINDLPNYAKRTGANAVRMRYPERRILMLNGGNMVTDNYLDRSCEASAQGKDRLTRGQLFSRYITQSFGELTEGTQLFKTVPKAGYDPVAMFSSPCAMAVIFGTGTCK